MITTYILGHVSIYLNNSTPRDEIELHAIGLDISKVITDLNKFIAIINDN